MLITYTQIQEDIARILQRDDLAGHIPDFIVKGESRLNSLVRVAQMEASTTIAMTNGAGPLPTDYLEYRRVLADSSPTVSLEAADPDWAILKYPGSAAANGIYFYIIGDSIHTKPVISSNVLLVYYKKIPPLAANTTGNWVTNRAPNLYVYSALLESAPFIDDDARLQTWGQLLDKEISQLHQSDAGARYARSVSRIRGCTP